MNSQVSLWIIRVPCGPSSPHPPPGIGFSALFPCVTTLISQSLACSMSLEMQGGKTGSEWELGRGESGWGDSWRGSRKLAIAGINQMGAEQSYAEWFQSNISINYPSQCIGLTHAKLWNWNWNWISASASSIIRRGKESKISTARPKLSYTPLIKCNLFIYSTPLGRNTRVLFIYSKIYHKVSPARSLLTWHNQHRHRQQNRSQYISISSVIR